MIRNYIYPIRKSRSFWKIPLYCTHECNPFYCHSVSTDRENNRIVIQLNRDGPCELQNKLVQTYIHIYSYNFLNPQGHSGILHNVDNIVIFDNTFTILIEFPLTNHVAVEVSSEVGTFTLRELLQLIKVSYQKIYEQEEATATPQVFEINRSCSCTLTPLQTYIEDIDAVDDNCSVCYNPLETNVGKIPCGHIFHKDCLTQWIDTGRGATCPLCRSTLSNCSECEGSLMVTEEYEGTVLPYEYRDVVTRNNTDGIYGIYGFDLQQLIIEGLIYNRVSKKLKVIISVI